MSRHLTLLLCTLTLIAGCSGNPERSSAVLPTAPSAAAPGSLLGPTSVAPGGISGKFDVSFPGRDQSFDFRNQLETKYQTGLGRSAAPPDGLIAFPPRTDSFDFRRQLESKYEQFGRGFSESTVDAEGGVIWTQEYLRYRVNQCDHLTSVQKVFSQIDGGGVAATCFVPPCLFTVSPSTQTIPAAGGTFAAIITKTSNDRSEQRTGGDDDLFDQDDDDATVTHSQSGASPTFSFTQTCGGPGSTVGGVERPLNVTLTVTDSNGTTTVQSGSGSQPPLVIKFFTC